MANNKVLVVTPPAFFEWLDEVEAELNLNDNQLAIRARISNSVLSKARSGTQAIGWDACKAIAEALNLPADGVMRKAGLLPTPPSYDAELEEMLHIYRQLDENGQQELLDLAMVKMERAKRGKSGAETAKKK